MGARESMLHIRSRTILNDTGIHPISASDNLGHADQSADWPVMTSASQRYRLLTALGNIDVYHKTQCRSASRMSRPSLV